MLHPNIFTSGAVQLVAVILFGGENLFVHRVQRSDFFRCKNFVVMLGDLLKFSGRQPLAFAIGADFNRLAVVFIRLENGMAAGAFHKFLPDYAAAPAVSTQKAT
jgi:hypothetical protein